MVAAKHQVASFCGDCHAVPTPDQFPQSAWPEEIEDGYRFYFDSGRFTTFELSVHVPMSMPMAGYAHGRDIRRGRA